MGAYLSAGLLVFVLSQGAVLAADLNGFPSDAVLLNAPEALDTLRQALGAQNMVPLAAAQDRPERPVRASGMDAFDPAAFRLLGGEIGGGGVQGGGVVSLTWATNP